MDDKQEILGRLREEFERWEALLGELGEEEIVAEQEGHSGGLSIKDEVAHLWAWQQRSNARMEAAVEGYDAPRFPDWPVDPSQEGEEALTATNAWIYETNRARPWAEVYGDWREGYLRLIRQAEAVPEADLLEVDRYPWLKGHALAEVLEGTIHHHHEEHLERLLARLGWDEG